MASRVLRTGGLYFDGDDIVEVPNSPSLQVLDATFEAWIYALSLPPNHGAFLAKWHWAEGGFEVLSSGYLRFDHGNITSNEAAVVSTFPIELNRWYHVAVTRDTSTKTAKLYINGILNNTNIYTLTVAKSDKPVWLGWRPDKVWEHFHGFIALPRIYNRALTDAEISEIYTKGTFIKDGLVLCLPFYEGEGNIAHDVSGYGNHGTIYGASWIVKKALRVLPKAR